MTAWLRRVLVIAATLSILLGAGIYTVLDTPGGSRWLIARIGTYLPDSEITGVSGTLWRGLAIQHVHIRSAPWHIEATDLSWRWRLSNLVDNRLIVTHLTAARLVIAGGPTPAGDDSPLLLPLAVAVEVLSVADLHVDYAGQVYTATGLQARILAAGEHIEITQLAGEVDGIVLQGNAEIGLNSPNPLQASLTWRTSRADTGPLQGRGELEGDLDYLRLTHRLALPFMLRTEAELDLSGEFLTLRAKGDWQDAHWPLQEPAQITSPHGSYHLDGPLEDLAIYLDGDFSGNFSGRDITFPATATARLHSEDLVVQAAEFRTLDGRVLISGSLDWHGPLRFHLDLLGEQLNPATLAADWPGRLDLNARVQGLLADQGTEIDLELLRTSGTLRAYPVQASGGIELRGERVKLRGLNLSSGPSKVHLQGRAAPDLDLALELQAPELAALWPGLSGSAQARGQVAGSYSDPQLTIQVEAQAVQLDALALDRLQADLAWRSERAHADIKLVGIGLDDRHWGGGQLQLTGKPTAHTLEITLDDGPIDLLARLRGGLDSQRWRGEIVELAVSSNELGQWQSTRAAELSVAVDTARLGELCLTRNPARLCATADLQADRRIRAAVKLDELSWDALQPLLPPNLDLSGRIDAELKIAGTLDDPSAELQVRPQAGQVSGKIEGEPPLEIAFSDVLLAASYRHGVARAQASLSLPERGQAHADLTIGKPQTGGTRSLTGKLQGGFPDLALLAGLVPQARLHRGSLVLDANLAGTLQAPTFNGELALRDARVEYPDMGLDLEQINLSLRNQGGDRLLVAGTLRSGDGDLRIEGDVRTLPDQGWPLALRIDGDKVRVVQLPEAQAVASPALRVDGSLHAPRISGRITIPEAKIEVRELPQGNVQVSADEVIVDTRVPAPQPANGRLQADITVALGKAVSLKAYGLTTRLSGDLRIRLQDGQTQAEGVIDLADGSYKAYGQDLSIERGRFLFGGAPDNPNLDVRAVRVSKNGDVRAYLALDGSLRRPRTRIYTEPARNETDALSYLLTGSGRGEAGSLDSAALLQAAGSLGLDKSTPALQTLRAETHLDELRFDTENGLANAALVGGKYLNPDLYISYAQSLLSPQGTVSLRYRLSKNISVETRSGINQSVDLIYSIEKE